MIDPVLVMQRLTKERPIFHSEADFQHAFAWLIQEQSPTCSLRLEYPLSLEKSDHLDILVSNSNDVVAIELKYKTRFLRATCKNELFHLKNHSAQDCGRYDFLKDIQRLEEFISKRTNAMGYALLLTNDSSYWELPRNDSVVDASFRIHEGKLVHGTLSWGSRASKGTTKNREKAIIIKGNYKLTWQEYSKAVPRSKLSNRNSFRYLLVNVITA